MAKQTTLYMSDGSTLEEVLVATDYSLVKNKPSNYPPTAHNHDASNITSGTLGVDNLPDGVLKPIALTSGQDLNTITSPGLYGSTSTAIWKSILNRPTENVTEGYLEVASFGSGSTTYLKQTISGNRSGVVRTWHRIKTGSTTWSAWREVLNSDEISSWAKASTKPSYNASEITETGSYKILTFTERAKIAKIDITENLSVAFDSKAPTNHASTGNTYGLGTTTDYGHVKVRNDLSQTAHENGVALSAYQGKILKDSLDTVVSQLDSKSFKVLTSAQYDALSTKDTNTVYFVV